MSAITLTVADLESKVGQEVAVSPWTTVSQEQIQRFADATGDHQWIHVDPEKAKAGPFGGTVNTVRAGRPGLWLATGLYSGDYVITIQGTGTTGLTVFVPPL